MKNVELLTSQALTSQACFITFEHNNNTVDVCLKGWEDVEYLKKPIIMVYATAPPTNDELAVTKLDDLVRECNGMH